MVGSDRYTICVGIWDRPCTQTPCVMCVYVREYGCEWVRACGCGCVFGPCWDHPCMQTSCVCVWRCLSGIGHTAGFMCMGVVVPVGYWAMHADPMCMGVVVSVGYWPYSRHHVYMCGGACQVLVMYADSMCICVAVPVRYWSCMQTSCVYVWRCLSGIGHAQRHPLCMCVWVFVGGAVF